MSEWWTKYEGLIGSAGKFFPEENWLLHCSISNFKLGTYRIPVKNPRSLIFLFHGLHNTALSWTHIAHRLAKENLLVLAMDQESHGKSEGIRGQVRSIEGYIEDSYQYILKVKLLYPGLPVLIMGESMGGLLAVNLSLKIPDLRGIILFSPALGRAISRCNKILNKLIGFFLPTLKNHSAPLNRNSKNPYFTDWYIDNPYTYELGTDYGTVRSLLNAYDSTRTQFERITVPVLTVQGDSDYIIDARVVREFMDRITSTDKTYLTPQGVYHSITNEPEVMEILKQVIDWINKRI